MVHTPQKGKKEKEREENSQQVTPSIYHCILHCFWSKVASTMV